jgi:hypothetical protein
MKELSIEEKAKRYDEALEKFHQFIDGYTRREISKEILEDIFHELRDFDNEKIRKALVKYFTSRITNPDYEICGVPFNDVLAWLEKQGESKYTVKQWKPSEGQLECLGYAIEKAEKDWSPLITNRVYLTLKALKEQLEKL